MRIRREVQKVNVSISISLNRLCSTYDVRQCVGKSRQQCCFTPGYLISFLIQFVFLNSLTILFISTVEWQ